jgi:hypothetical protein
MYSDLDIGETILLKLISKKYSWRLWTGLIWLRIGTGSGLCEGSNEVSGFMKRGEFLDQSGTSPRSGVRRFAGNKLHGYCAEICVITGLNIANWFIIASRYLISYGARFIIVLMAFVEDMLI